MKKLAVILCLLVACSSGGPQVQAGLVVDTDHEPAWTEMRTVVSYGPNGQMTTSIIPVAHPDEYRLQIEGPHPDDDSVKGRQWVTVDPAQFAGCRVGDRWARNEGCAE